MYFYSQNHPALEKRHYTTFWEAFNGFVSLAITGFVVKYRGGIRNETFEIVSYLCGVLRHKKFFM